jgi:putative PIN family toxin of toxin-antitoxin system
MSTHVVFGCMIFLQAAANPRSAAFACFERVESAGLTLCVSPEILLEAGDALRRPKLVRKFPLLTGERVGEFLDSVQRRSTMITQVPRSYLLPRDPKDEPYLNLAIATGAKYLVSRDNDLLDLMREDSPEGAEFRQ